MLRASFLGQYELHLDDKPVIISSHLDQLLLAYLMLNADRRLSREQLAGIFWPDSLEAAARKNLRNSIWRLRRAIGKQFVLADKSTVAFDRSASYQLDVDILESETIDTAGLIEAVSSYQGELLPGFYEDWVQLRREHLSLLYGRRTQDLLAKLTDASRWSDVFIWADRWIAQGLVPEPAYRYLMQAFAATGDLSGVASTYQRCLQDLDSELGVEPSAETRTLYEHLVKGSAPETPPSPPGPGELDPANRYLQESLLAAGGQGEVYLGRDLVSGEQVVIKHLLPELSAGDPTFMARFVREGEALAQLNHPNIVRMIAAFERNGQHQIVMEYISGGSLRELLDKEGKLSIERALDIGLEVADALSRAHHLGIIHRDIKPGNVLLAADGTPRLTDFGLARVEKGDDHLTQVGSIIGSPAYLSPEALAGEALDERSDIWSFGVMLFEMLAGRNPFQADQISVTMATILTEPLPDLMTFELDCPKTLAALVEQMLIKERDQRISSMRQVAAELEAIRAGKLSSQVWQSEKEESTELTEEPGKSHELPIPATPFIGRDREIGDLHQLLVDAPANRLITIVGPGGIGKSRLALEAAAAAAHRYTDGVYFVPLAALDSAEHIVSLLAENLGYRFWGSAEPTQQLLDYLASKKMLLVTDNFEHVLEGADLAADIIRKAPEVKILATSRERLHLSGETVYALGGMDYPLGNEAVSGSDKSDLMAYGAVQLLHHHAQMVHPGHIWEREELVEMARICQKVQGMPLAIVLAAGWLELLSLSEITGEIAHSLDILESETRDIPERQRSVRAAFDYSWKRLSVQEQEMFMKLAVFRGGFSRMAAQEVSGAGLRTLRSLTEKSLITTSASKSYEIHELLRQFIEEKLEQSGSVDQTRANHSAYYLSAVAAREADLKGRRQLEALDEIEEDLENVRAAWNWAVNNRHWDAVNNCLESLYLFFDMRSRYQEGVEFFILALSHVPDGTSDLLRGRLMARQNWLRCRYSTDRPEIGTDAELCLAIAENYRSLPDIAFAKLLLGYHRSKVMSDFETAIPFFEESLAGFRELDDSFHAARNLIRIGYCYGQAEGTQNYLLFTRMGLDLATQIGDKFEASIGLGNLASNGFVTGNYNLAEEYLIKSLALAEEIGDRVSLGHTRAQFGLYLLLQGEPDQALKSASRALNIAEDISFKITIAYALAVLSGHAGLTGDYILAQRLGRQSQETPSNYLGETIGDWALAIAYTGLHKDQQAKDHIIAGVGICQRFGWPGMLHWLLPIEAIRLARIGRSERAVQLLSLAYNHPTSAQGWIDRWDLIAAMKKELRDSLGPSQFDENWQRGQELDLESTAAEILATVQ